MVEPVCLFAWDCMKTRGIDHDSKSSKIIHFKINIQKTDDDIEFTDSIPILKYEIINNIKFIKH